jgi:hypothetical protein
LQQVFIPDFATIAKPLRDLTRKNQRWRLSSDEENAFATIKKAIISNTTAYFDKDLKTQLIVDASPVGLGAVLTQFNPKKPHEKKIITQRKKFGGKRER